MTSTLERVTGTVGVLRKCIETVRRQQQDEFASLLITSDILSELLNIVEAVAKLDEGGDEGLGCWFCGGCPEIKVGLGFDGAPHDEDCAYVTARKLAGGAP